MGKIKLCLTFTFPLQEFIREGCLYKLTKKGLQQRMFFLVGTTFALLQTAQGLQDKGVVESVFLCVYDENK